MFELIFRSPFLRAPPHVPSFSPETVCSYRYTRPINSGLVIIFSVYYFFLHFLILTLTSTRHVYAKEKKKTAYSCMLNERPRSLSFFKLGRSGDSYLSSLISSGNYPRDWRQSRSPKSSSFENFPETLRPASRRPVILQKERAQNSLDFPFNGRDSMLEKKKSERENDGD